MRCSAGMAAKDFGAGKRTLQVRVAEHLPACMPSPLASRLLSQDLAHGRPGQAIGRDALHSHSNSAIISSDSEEKLLTVLFDFSTDRDDLWYLGELWPATAREDTIASLIGTRLRARGARALSQSTCHIRGVYTNRLFYCSYHADNYM